MTFPASVDTVTLTVGPLLGVGGIPRQGVPLTVTMPRRVLILESGAVLPSVATARTGADGTASLTLVATDSGGLDSNGWTYLVRCPGVLPAAGKQVALPAAAPSVAVETLAEVDTADGETIWVPDGSSWVALVESDLYPGLYRITGGTYLTESETYPGLYEIGA